MAMPVVPLFLTNLYSFKLSFRSDLNVSKNAEKKEDSATEPHDENVSSRRLHSTECENDFTGTASNELPCHEAQRFCKFLLQCEPQVVQKFASSPEPRAPARAAQAPSPGRLPKTASAPPPSSKAPRSRPFEIRTTPCSCKICD